MSGGRGLSGAVRTCASCLAWGHTTMARQLCSACLVFARSHPVGECAGCGRDLPVRNQYCRLCWCQARTLARDSGHRLHTAGAKAGSYLAQVRYHQLFFANMLSCRGGSTTPARQHDRRGAPLKPPPPPAGRPTTRWAQASLFDNLPRDYTRFHEREDANPHNPWLAWGLHLAHRLAEARGWTRRVRSDVHRSLTILLSHHLDGDMVSYSAMFTALRALELSCDRPADVLTAMGILVDDRRSSFEDWLEDKLDGIAAGIARETEIWLRALRAGGPRARPRSIETVWNYAGTVRPVLLQWSARHDHLREITRKDVLAALDTLHGPPRQRTLTVLRSLFGFCKRSGAIFGNPTSRIRVGDRIPKLIQPLQPEQIRQTVASATRPADRLILALAAVHAARSGAIRTLQLQDVDLGNRRLTIADFPRPLDELTYKTLLTWLHYRHTRWPNSANPHLIVNQMTALELGPVSRHWIDTGFRGQPATLERLRVDRQLEEALTHGPDPLHLAVVFNLSHTTASRYATSARQLLQTAIESNTPG